MYVEVTECNVRQIVDRGTIRCELMAMKQKYSGFVVRNGEPGNFFVENGVHCYCDKFFRWYPDEIARLTARQSGSNNIYASETPRLRLLEKCRLWFEDGGVAAKRLEQVQWISLVGK